MVKLPGVAHVALTVTDLAVSVPWYERLLGSRPVMDEDTGAYHHTVWLLPGGILLSLHQFPGGGGGDRFDERRVGLGSPLLRGSRTAPSWRRGRPGSRSSASGTAGSSTPTTARRCRSAIPTTSPWSCSRRPTEPGDQGQL
jgi:glyoxylase I family protein